MGVLVRTQGISFHADEDGAMRWIAEQWTVNDQDALDAIGPEMYWQWVERGYAGD